MNKKKAAKRTYKVTLDSFKTDLNAGKYAAATGARRAASYMPETDKAAALKLVAKHFGIGVDEPGPTGRKGAKRKVGKKKVAKAVAAGKFKPSADGVGLPKRKPGRPRKNSEPEGEKTAAAAEPTAAPAEPKKRRGRQPKAKVEAKPLRTPEPEAPKRQSRKGSHDTDHLDQIGLIGRAMGPLDSALKILERANQLANGQISTTGFQEIADTATEAVRALRPHVSRLAHQDPPPPPVPSNGQAERPFDPALLEAAAQSAGIPLPGDDSVQ